ncbi:MAG: hypothetical protein PHQ12_14305 [Chthoniobacteraceae bacterium]|nr:hypothetical protein [Chthoniobacteraceae bacterium]
MKRSSLSLLVAVTALGVFFGSMPRLGSQEAAVRPKTPEQQLAALKAANAELLQRQQKTLQKLDDIKQQADQLRTLTKRS